MFANDPWYFQTFFFSAWCIEPRMAYPAPHATICVAPEYHLVEFSFILIVLRHNSVHRAPLSATRERKRQTLRNWWFTVKYQSWVSIKVKKVPLFIKMIVKKVSFFWQKIKVKVVSWLWSPTQNSINTHIWHCPGFCRWYDSQVSWKSFCEKWKFKKLTQLWYYTVIQEQTLNFAYPAACVV